MLSRISLLHAPMATRVFPLATPSIALPFNSSVIPSRSSNLACCTSSALIGGSIHAENRRLVRVCAEKKVRDHAGKAVEKQLMINVNVSVDDCLPHDDHEILSIAQLLRQNVPMAMKLAFDGLKDSKYKFRDTAITNFGQVDAAELSILLCNDEVICKFNKEWKGKDGATDVLSVSQHFSKLELPILVLGDIVISVDTAARQAKERGHNLVEEIQILVVHGLLHLLGFDSELGKEAATETKKVEEHLLGILRWKGEEPIQGADDAQSKESFNEKSDGRIKEVSLQCFKPKFSYIFCDMDGTLLNSERKITLATANALKEAMSKGVKVVIATGKARSGAVELLKTVDLAGVNGIASEFSPGVFLQGLLVYGRQGQQLFRRSLDPDVCVEAFLYSREHKAPLIAFGGDRCFTLFEHPLVDKLHSVFREPQAEILSSVDDILAASEIQKLIFYNTVEKVATLRPYWSEAINGRAKVNQALPEMLEIVPFGTSKENGVRLLLDHLGISAKEIMAIGDGENDIEMLELASLGVALSNGSEKTKAVANVIGLSNDEDGVADAIYRYAL